MRTDQYGNNIDISAEIFTGGLSPAALVTKWTEYLIDRYKQYLRYTYCIGNVRPDDKGLNIFLMTFLPEEKAITDLILDLVSRDITSIQELAAEIYGKDSVETYIVKSYEQVFEKWKRLSFPSECIRVIRAKGCEPKLKEILQTNA